METTTVAVPERLWLVRHAESAGNVARDAAEASGLEAITISGRDLDVPLSALGQRQANALGRWFGERPPGERPTVVLSSPYVRAMQTTRLLLDAAGWPRAEYTEIVDERLREKEFGSLNRLTKAGILARFPAEAELRSSIGKFYYRPPGGESWCDVVLRVRAVLDEVERRYAGERVLVVAHQVTVLCARYALEHLTEAELLAVDRAADVANCSVTRYASDLDPRGRARLTLQEYNSTAALERVGEAVTEAPDPPAAPR